MIPPFDADGFLPPGMHPSTPDEIRARFGDPSELRRVQMESVIWMLDLARRAGISRIVLNGSFTTDIMEPNDVDCVLLLLPGQRKDASAVAELTGGLPFLDINLVGSADFDRFVNRFFAADRHHRPKGMIEVILWN